MTKTKTVQWIGLCLMVALIVAMNLMPFGRWFDTFQETLKQAGSTGLLLFVCAGTVAILLFVPVSVPVTVAGLFFGFPAGLIPAFAVLALGAAGGFGIGRLLWPKIKYRALFDRPVFQAVRRAIEHDGYILLALLRMTPVMHYMTSNIFFGSLKIRFGPYLLASLLGMIPGTVLVVYGASVASTTFSNSDNVSLWEWALFTAGLLLFIGISWRLTRKVRKILQESDGDKSTESAR